MRNACLLAAITVLVVVEPSFGAVAAEESRCVGSFCNTVVTYRGEPGEHNVLSIRPTEKPTEMVLSDTGATIRGCPAFEGGVRCQNLSGVVYAWLGDGDDQASRLNEVWGGAGNDRLASASRASGGPGDDVVTNVRMIHDDDGEAPGHDVYVGAAPPVDSVSSDTRAELHYDKRAVPVQLDLRPGQSTEDQVSGIPKIYGTKGADTFTGDDGPNELYGLGGRDVVRGLGGDDVLVGDTLDGGAGDDTLSGGSHGGRIRCGAGRDVVTAGPRAWVAADCESLRLADEDGVGPRVTLRLSMARATSSFVTGIEPCRCGATDRWTVRIGKTVVASLSPSRRHSTLRLNAAGQRLLRRSGRVRADVQIRVGRPAVRHRFTLDLDLRPTSER
ncbi:hypothetical protein OJ997_32490 [Solirubrobacter phytolaccae]|uniref:Calcium-binding protein n=1 Tax=Solirubrobacter phytolaccae TaxID=1404360 RepID=A0A9X3NFA2_9ACTN|nr:calcium-binding protein [Solirubrobacter phytolaccae]MDA0185069.1 hypothetical protein [Solirubrobacter phytolaccae]